jgi:hypothetical protein
MLVEDAALNGQAGIAPRTDGGLGKSPRQYGTPRRDDPGAEQRLSAGPFQRLDEAQAIEQPNRFRAQVLGAGFLPRKRGAIHHHDPEAAAREMRGRGAPRGAGAGDQHVNTFGHSSKLGGSAARRLGG